MNCVRSRYAEPRGSAPRTAVQARNTACWTIHPKLHIHMHDRPDSSIPNNTENLPLTLLKIYLTFIEEFCPCFLLCPLHKTVFNLTSFKIYSEISNLKWNFTVKFYKSGILSKIVEMYPMLLIFIFFLLIDDFKCEINNLVFVSKLLYCMTMPV